MVIDADNNRLDACYPPYTSQKAYEVYRAISKNAQSASKFISGMASIFIGLDKEYIRKVVKKYNNIDLTRYTSHVDMYEQKMIEEENEKRKNP